MKTCIAIAIRFEETLIVQEHSTLKYGTFLGLKKRGNCTQLLEKTFREGKGPNHFSFLFFFLPSSSLLPHHLSHQNFPSILSIKNRSNQPMILENPPFPSTNRYIIAPTISLLSFTPSPCFYNFAPIFLSSETYITFFFHSHSWPRVETPSVCAFPRPTAPFPPLLHPKTWALATLSPSLCPFYTERALLEFTYPTIETNRVIYTFAAIWAHTAERRAEIEDGERRARAWPLWRYKPQTRQTNSRPRKWRKNGPMNFPTTILSPSIFSFLFLFFFFISEWQPFKFRHKAQRFLSPSPFDHNNWVPLSTPVLKVHCDRNEGGKKIGQDRVSFSILFSLFFLSFFLNWSQLLQRASDSHDRWSFEQFGSRCYNYSYFSACQLGIAIIC